MAAHRIGISGLAAYLPPYRVDLQGWCGWTGNNWDKVQNVVGTGFRMLGPDQSIYTMAANAALRLIDQYEIDPRRIRFLALGTESSTDNSAGAVIIRGMLDEALRQRGAHPINRSCEVPEFKHACLGGVYAMKNALRFLALEPEDAVAIVVSADQAKYDLGSSGEPTQGAGAVAMLLEKDPDLLEIDITACGSASDYRAVDFRKPLLKANKGSSGVGAHFKDTPVFNGKYSTSCYLDETLHALRDMEARLGRPRADYYAGLRAVFMHRPYHRMPISSWAFNYLVGLAQDGAAGRSELAEYCEAAGLSLAEVIAEMSAVPDILGMAKEGDLDRDPYPLTMELLKVFRKHPRHQTAIEDRMALGTDAVRELGNIYSASLPAWIAAGMEEALNADIELAGADMLAIGYGSGDAAEAIPMRVAANWREAAARIRFAESLEQSIDLSEEQYRSLHSTGHAESLARAWNQEFLVDRVGSSVKPSYADNGIEYYRYVGDEAVERLKTVTGTGS